MGTIDRYDAVLSAPDVPRSVRDRPARADPVRSGLDDHVGRARHLGLWPDLLRHNRHLLLLRFVHSDLRVFGNASSVHGPVDISPHGTGADLLRHSVWSEHGSTLLPAGPRRHADVL